MKPVDLLGIHVEATSGTPLVVLQEQEAPHRLLPIFIGPNEAASIALAVSGESPPRPLTHDLMASIVRAVDVEVRAVEVTELREGTFIADLAIRTPAGDRRLDTRPSDAIALAVRVGAPLYVSEAVLDEAASLPASEELDEETIAEAVAEFRSFLDDVDPSTFEDPGT